jgi:hypothetical protein
MGNIPASKPAAVGIVAADIAQTGAGRTEAVAGRTAACKRRAARMGTAASPAAALPGIYIKKYI